MGGAVLWIGLAVLGGVLLFGQLRQRNAVRTAFPELDGRISVAGIEAPVEIYRDAHGVPHIEAASERDAAFGLGFAQAQDRLAQMLWQRRIAHGRTAEVVGRSGLQVDRYARRLGFRALAEAELERLDAGTRAFLEAYAAGVNARLRRIESGEAGVPLALRDRESPPEPWSAADSLALFKLYSWGLSSTVDVSLVLSDLIEQLGGFDARPFFPHAPGEDAVPGVLPSATAFRARPGQALRDLEGLVPDPLRRAAGLEGRTVGSSAWVLAGEHTESGHPVLIADAHLEPTVPAVLHVAHFRGGGLDAAGATLPGVPVVLTGHNGRVAWASTHSRAVVCDLFEETLKPGDDTRYHDGRRWRELEERVEVIRVRGGEDESLRVRSTRHGPLISEAEDGSAALAVHWIGARPRGRSGVSSLLAVARADAAESLREALASHEEPVLVFAYADAAGEAGVQVAGWVPQRALFTGLVPVPGRARWYDWEARIPFAALPQERLEATRPWVIAADDALGGAEGGEDIEWLWRSGARARRVDALLEGASQRGPMGLRALVAQQSDVGVEGATELVRLTLRDAAGGDLGPEAQEVRELLQRWDGMASADSVGAAAYHVFLENLTEALLTPHLGEELLGRYLSLPQTDPGKLVLEIVRAGTLRRDRDSIRAAIRKSLRDTWFGLVHELGSNRTKWNWGRLHPLRFRPLGQVAGRSFGREGLGPFSYGGNGDTVGAAEYDPARPYDVRVAATFRFAVDTGALGEALTSLVPGQSEHREHPHYQDGLERWLEGGSRLLVTSPLLVEETSVSRLLLEPRS